MIALKNDQFQRVLRIIAFVMIAAVVASCGGDGSDQQPQLSGSLTFVARGKVQATEGDISLINRVLPVPNSVGDDVIVEYTFRTDAIDEAQTNENYGMYVVQSISMKIGTNSPIVRTPPHTGHIHITRYPPDFKNIYAVSNSSAILPCNGDECIQKQIALQLVGAPSNYLRFDAVPLEPPNVSVFGTGPIDRLMTLDLALPNGNSYINARLSASIESVIRR